MYLFGRPPGVVLERSGLRGLGDAETETDCIQPVPTAERDALRNEIKDWTSPWAGPHYHENHPDLVAIFNDITGRLRGLEQRPKLLRCSKEARDRARRWIAQLEELDRRVKQRGTTGPQGCTAATWVRITEPFPFTVYRGPTYTVRPGTTRPDCFGAGGAQATKPSGAVQSSAPPGSVVIEGVTYSSSAAAAATSGGGSTAPSSAPEGGAVTPTTAPPAILPSLPSLEGSVAGIPTKYLLYGVLALLAFKMVK